MAKTQLKNGQKLNCWMLSSFEQTKSCANRDRVREPSLPTRQLVLKVVPTEISFRLEGKGGSEEKSVRILGFKSVRSRPFLNLEGQFLHQNFQKLFLFKSY